MNVALFLEIKNEYTEHLVDTLSPYIYEGLTSIYKDAVKLAEETNSESKTLMIFQKCLQAIDTWNQIRITDETNRIKQLSNTAEYLDDLIKAVIKSNIILLAYSNTISNIIAQTFYNSFTTQIFIHRCYTECGKDAHNNPYFFYHNVDPMDFKRNQIIIQQNIQSGIIRAIRKVLPISVILKEYLVNSINIIQEPPKVELVGSYISQGESVPIKNYPSPKINTIAKSNEQRMDPKLERDVMKIIKSDSIRSDKDKIQALMNIDKILTSIEPNIHEIKKFSSIKKSADKRSDLMIPPHLLENEVGVDIFNLNQTDKNILNIDIGEEASVGIAQGQPISATSMSARILPGKLGMKLNPEISERIDPSKIRLIENYGTMPGSKKDLNQYRR